MCNQCFHVDQTALDLMGNYNLVYDIQYSIIICTTCKKSVGNGLKQHYNRKHLNSTIPMSSAIETLILKQFSKPTSTIDKSVVHPMNKYLKVYDGYRCTQCGSCFQKKNSMVEHIRQSSHNRGYLPTKMQTISHLSARHFFGITEALTPGMLYDSYSY